MNRQSNRHHEAEITKFNLGVSALLVLAVVIIVFVHSQQ